MQRRLYSMIHGMPRTPTVLRHQPALRHMVRDIYDYDTKKARHHRQGIRKRPVCPRVPGQLSLAFAACRGAEARAFWQRRFYDFNVWSEGKLKEKLEYRHANPLKRSLVVSPGGLAVEQLGALRKG